MNNGGDMSRGSDFQVRTEEVLLLTFHAIRATTAADTTKTKLTGGSYGGMPPCIAEQKYEALSLHSFSNSDVTLILVMISNGYICRGFVFRPS